MKFIRNKNKRWTPALIFAWQTTYYCKIGHMFRNNSVLKKPSLSRLAYRRVGAEFKILKLRQFLSQTKKTMLWYISFVYL